MQTTTNATNAATGLKLAAMLRAGLYKDNMLACDSGYKKRDILSVCMLAFTYESQGQFAGNAYLSTMQPNVNCLACEIISDESQGKYYCLSNDLSARQIAYYNAVQNSVTQL